MPKVGSQSPQAKSGGSWKAWSNFWAKHNGSWKKPLSVHVKSGGSWVKVWDERPAFLDMAISRTWYYDSGGNFTIVDYFITGSCIANGFSTTIVCTVDGTPVTISPSSVSANSVVSYSSTFITSYTFIGYGPGSLTITFTATNSSGSDTVTPTQTG
jgi:hypothetical protein